MFGFYQINSNYINFLKQYESKIPNVIYSSKNKFVCGVVLKMNGFAYFAPVSHFSIKQRTNFPIYKHDEIISTVRLCFMFPIPNSISFDEILQKLDFREISKTDKNYARLLQWEYTYCKVNLEKLVETAKKVYKIGTNKKHVLNHNCCDFLKLESICNTYNPEITYIYTKSE